MCVLSGAGLERRMINPCLKQPGTREAEQVSLVKDWGLRRVAGEFCLVEAGDYVCKSFIEGFLRLGLKS